MRKNNVILVVACGLIFFILGGLSTVFFLQEKYGSVRSATTALTQTINAGTLTADIVDAAYAPVASPSIGMGSTTFSFSCGTATGTLGTASQQLYVKNPDAADSGWSLTIAASSPGAVWDSAGTDYDFNDSTGSGCTDGADTDSVGGQLTMDASVGTLAIGACSACATTNISKGTSAAFVETTGDSITLLSAASGSSDIGDWTLQGVSLSQKIPAEQPAASDYDISFTLTVTAL